MYRIAFVLRRALRRITHHPLVSISLFFAFACIGALLAPYLGIDPDIMMRSPALPYIAPADALRLASPDEEFAAQIRGFAQLQGIDYVELLEQDEQCMTPQGLRSLRIQSLVSDDKHLLNLPLADDEAALNAKFSKRLGLYDGDSISIQGERYRIRILRDNMEGGVELMLSAPLCFGLQEHVVVLMPRGESSALSLLEHLQSTINHPISPREQGGLITYELVKEREAIDRVAIERFYTSLLFFALAGTLFTLSQMSALMRYHAQKCRREDGLCRQWQGLDGLIREQLLSIGPLAFLSSLVGYFISTYALNSISGASPSGTLLGSLLAAGITSLFSLAFTFAISRLENRNKSLSQHMKEDM